MPMRSALSFAALFLLTASFASAQDHAADRMPMKARVPPSHAIVVTFEGRQTTLSFEDLADLPQVTVHVHNAHRDVDEDYTGPLLSAVLAKAGLVASRETEPLILHSSIVATGTDKYFVLYSAAEVEPMFSNSKVIVAIAKDHGLPNEEGGNIELVNTDGAKPARWLHGLVSLLVMTAHQNQ